MPDYQHSTANTDELPVTGKLLSVLFVCLLSFLLTAPQINADDLSDPGIWYGEWQAEDTDFTLRVLPSGTHFRLQPLRPAGIEWQAGEGLINGSSGTVEVRYQGVVAQVMVQLTGPESATVRSTSCQPDYHVVCTLVRNQQARFVKLQ